jgi:hypothetical protein
MFAISKSGAWKLYPKFSVSLKHEKRMFLLTTLLDTHWDSNNRSREELMNDIKEILKQYCPFR